MKILQVVQGIPPESNGGTQIYAYNLSKALSEEEETSILYVSKKYSPYNINKTEYSVNFSNKDNMNLIELSIKESLNRIFNPQYSIYNPEIDEIFEKILIQTAPDIIHIHHLSNFSYGIIPLAKKYKIPVVFTLHDIWFICHKVSRIDINNEICSRLPGKICSECQKEFLIEYITQKNDVCKILGKNNLRPIFNLFSKLFKWPDFFERRSEILINALIKSDTIIAPTNFIKDEYIKYGVPEKKILVSPHGIDIKPFEIIKDKKKRLNNDTVSFGYVGQAGFNKGVHLLIEAFNNLVNSNSTLKIFGDSKESAYSRELYNSAASSNIIFKGKFTPEDVEEIYKEFDVLIVPSVGYENSPLSISESFCNKNPVIASKTGGIPELINDGKNGLLFERGDAIDLQNKISMIIDNPKFFESLQEGILPVRDINDQANEMVQIYSVLLKKIFEQ